MSEALTERIRQEEDALKNAMEAGLMENSFAIGLVLLVIALFLLVYLLL